MGLFKKTKKALKELEAENKAKSEAFLKDYRELSQKHKLDITAVLSVQEQGIVPMLKIVEVKPQENK